jgi:hypothetical protein
MAAPPETRYAVSGGYHIAYQVAQDADRDIFYSPRIVKSQDVV